MSSVCTTTSHRPHEIKNQAITLINSMKRDQRLSTSKISALPMIEWFCYKLPLILVPASAGLQVFILKNHILSDIRSDVILPACSPFDARSLTDSTAEIELKMTNHHRHPWVSDLSQVRSTNSSRLSAELTAGAVPDDSSDYMSQAPKMHSYHPRYAS